MLFKRRFKTKFKTCPRCGLKMIDSVPECSDCGLVFDRLKLATNKDAKRKIKRGDRDFIIKTTKLPSDVKYWKLLLITIFAGLTGAHNYHVGRYLRGSIFSLLFTLTMLCVVFNSYIMAYYSAWMELIGAVLIGPFALVWIFDIIFVGIKRFKVPVAIDLEAEDIDTLIKEK